MAIIYPNRRTGTAAFNDNKDLQYLAKPTELAVTIKPKSSVLSNSDTDEKEANRQSNIEIKPSSTPSSSATTNEAANTKLLSSNTMSKEEITTAETTVAALETTTASTTVTTAETTSAPTTVSTTKRYDYKINRLGNASTTRKPIIRRLKTKATMPSETLETLTASTIIRNSLGNAGKKDKIIFRPTRTSPTSTSTTAAAATN